MNTEGVVAMNNNRVKPLDIVIGEYKFRLIGMSKPGEIANQIVLVESSLAADNSDKPIKFAVYRSVSQIIWRLAIIESNGLLNKFSDYTCTTQIHPDLQSFIESMYSKIPILPVEIINIRSYNYAYYYDLIEHGIKRNNKNLSQNDDMYFKIPKYFDEDRLLKDNNFELLSSGIFNHIGQVSSKYIESILKSKPRSKSAFNKEHYDNLQTDVEKYFPKGEYETIEIRDRLKIMSNYLHDKLKVVKGTECLEYYIDPAVSIIRVINYEENINQEAKESKIFDEQHFFKSLRTTGGDSTEFDYINPNKHYLAKRQAGANTSSKNNNMLKQYVSSNIALYERSPAVLSVKLVSLANKDDIYTLYYFDYKYRSKRYEIPINIIKEGTKINKFGLPEKYISLNSYAGKILDYLHQIEIYKDNVYDIYHISNADGDVERTYAYVGDLYDGLWPLPEIASLAKVAKRPCKPDGPRTYKRRIRRSSKRKNSKRSSTNMFNIEPASNSEYENELNNNQPVRKR
jgi:hypothetical protein